MKKLFTFMLLSVFAFASSAQITELWNFSVEAENQQSSGNYDKSGIAVSNDGTHLYRATRTANSVGVFKASDGSFVKDLTGMTATYGGDVAVDSNGAIYANDVSIGGDITVFKWTNESVAGTQFIKSTAANHGGTSANRLGYGMDVFVDENGDGFLLMHKNGTAEMKYWGISNNSPVSQNPTTISITGSPAAITDQYARISIIDKNTFWLDGNALRPSYCTITRNADDYSNPTAISGIQLGYRTDIAAGVGGATEFTLNGIRYGVFAANNHGTAYPIGHYSILQQLSETGVAVVGSVIAAELPTGGMGKATDASHFVESVVHVADNFAYIYSMGGFNGTAAAKVEAAKLTTLIPAAGSHEGTSLEITLTAGTAGADLYYTTNGTTPTNTSTKYTAPFSIGQGTTTVKVLAVKSGLLSSVTTAVYTVAPPEASEKTFTVTVPAGTEKVYVVGSFSGKNWDIDNPYELTATGNPNEFSGSFVCGDDLEYKYLNGKGDLDYAEAKLDGEDLVISEGKPASAKDRSYNAADVVKYWVASPSVKLNVSFAEGINTPANLFVKGDWDNWAAGKALTKSGDTYSLTVNEKTFANTEYKYYSNDPSADNWETINRWAIYPTMNDEITGFNTEIPAPTAQLGDLDLKFKKTDYAWNTGNAARSAAYYDGNLYVIDNGNTQVHKLNASSGAEVSGAVTDANYKGMSITMDNNGNQFVHSSYAATSGIGGTIVINGGSSTHSQALGITPNFGRVDYFAVTGNLATNAHIAGASTNTVDAIAVWKVENGVFTDMANPIQILGKRVEGGEFAASGDIFWVSDKKILITSQGKKAQIMTLDLNNPANSTSEAIGSVTTGAGGGAYFEMNGIPYVALATDRFGVVDIYDISTIATPDKIATTDAIGANANSAVHLSIMPEVKEVGGRAKASLYIWAPNNGLAVYELDGGPITSVKEPQADAATIRIMNTADGISIPLTESSLVELYTVNGMLIDRVVTADTYTHSLNQGIYIVRVNGQAMKFIK